MSQLQMQLSEVEQGQRERLESIVERGLTSFVEVGNALREIRDAKLYRSTHGTFEDYCRERWGMEKSHTYRIIDAAAVALDIKTSPIGEIFPANEAQARPLTRLEPEQRAAAWTTAVETAPNGKVTGAHVERVVSQIKRAERVERINEISSNNKPLELPCQYSVIYADPPWEYEHSKTDNRRIDNHYPTMTLANICALPVIDIATPDAVLFLWATSPKLEEALQVMRAWDFTYRTCMVWVKPQIGMGYYARQQHELLLIGARGSLPVPQPANRPNSALTAPRTEHSRKPIEYYEIIERMYPEYERLELFSRNSREGWTAWGNQS